MSIHQVIDCSFSDVIRQTHDVGVFSSGYEARCTFVSEQYKERPLLTPIVLGFQELADTAPRAAHDKYFSERWKSDPVIVSSGNDFLIQHLLNDVVSRQGPVTRILVDYSSMSRLWYSGILNWALYGTGTSETIIDFVYAVGKYEETNPPMIIEDMLSIPGCEGGALRSQRSLAVFGLGFNGWASLSVLERLEADEVFAFIASPGGSTEYPARVRELNKDFLDEPRVKSNVLEFPLRSVERTYRFLCELVTPHRSANTITLVPMGPKPHVLASILVSMRFVEVSCMRVSAKRLRPETIDATGEIVTTRVIVRKRQEKTMRSSPPKLLIESGTNTNPEHCNR